MFRPFFFPLFLPYKPVSEDSGGKLGPNSWMPRFSAFWAFHPFFFEPFVGFLPFRHPFLLLPFPFFRIPRQGFFFVLITPPSPHSYLMAVPS